VDRSLLKEPSSLFRGALLLFLSMTLLSACQGAHLSRRPSDCNTPTIILPPFAIAELSHHDAQYFTGMPYLFSRGEYRAARDLLKARALHPEISQAVRDRLIFAEALADLHLGLRGHKEGMDLLGASTGRRLLMKSGRPQKNFCNRKATTQGSGGRTPRSARNSPR
jgi:hypothetical protein